MRDLLSWALLAAVLPACAYAEEAAPSKAKVAVITNPDWVRKPGPDEFSRFWPSGAKSTGIVTIQCSVTVDGKLSGCVALQEDPPNQGFGPAALKIATYFQMKPLSIDGKPVGGGMFSTTIRFIYAGRPPPPQWVTRPTEAQIQAVWPDKAKGVPGMAMLNCTVDGKGHASHCHVEREEPKGKGFGAAALKLAPGFVMTGQTPTQQGILIPVVFTLPAPKQIGTAQYGRSLAALTNAPWLNTPTAADMAAAWPAGAPADLDFAKVRLRCGFKPEGGLDACEVLSEDPPTIGFAAAALALVPKFQARLEGHTAADVAKLRLILPLTFANPRRFRQSPEVITQYNWVRFIDQDRMTDLYPDKAVAAGIHTGRGVITCVVAHDGSLTDCKIDSEDPAGMDFGKTAMAAASYFAVNPWTDDGHPVDGAKVTLPIRFREAEPSPPPANPGG